jgi:hypothetical protein
VREGCTAEAADEITFLRGLEDLISRTAEACRKWGEDLAAVAYAGDLGALTPEELACQRVTGGWLARLHHKVVQTWGRQCHAAEFRGLSCRSKWRDRQLARLSEAVAARIEAACGEAFDRLALVSPSAGATLAGRIDALMDIVVGRARHLAERVYPPLTLGPTGLFGPAPVGVRTFDLVDPSRMNTAGTGPRPLRVEVYYPSTTAAVSGVKRDFFAPTYRNVARAPGSFPLVLFSPGQGSAPSGYAFLAAHLASHGILVAGITHHGDLSDPDITDNRPLDLKVVLDQLLALNGEPGSIFQNAIDASRIGALGHSLGAYTVMALATCSVPSTFDARVKAILPIEASTQFFSTQARASSRPSRSRRSSSGVRRVGWLHSSRPHPTPWHRGRS